MNLLALETATDRCSVALSVDAGVCARVDERPRVHARRVLGMVEACLAEGGIGAHEVDAYAFGRGPGSFTGVRIGAGVVQGLALGTGRPVVPVSTLAGHAVAARRLHGAVQTAVCVDARLGECYWGLYRVQEDGLAEALAPDALAREESCGTHFREEYQTPEGEALRDDENFSHVAAWEHRGDGESPALSKEPLEFEYVKLTQRSYK